MLKQIFFFCAILFITTIINFSCVGDPYTNGTQHPSSNTHNYPTDTEGNELNPDIDRLTTTEEESDRYSWQKPREVIKRLGNLSDKTVADIGAGPYGFFTFQLVMSAEKVIATDIANSAVAYMDSVKMSISDVYRDKIEVRLVPSNDPMLKEGEADLVFISNLYVYLNTEYLEKVKKGMPIGGRICILDYKMKKLPGYFPPVSERIPLYQVENDLETAGFKHVTSYDKVLDYQYIVIAEKVE